MSKNRQGATALVCVLILDMYGRVLLFRDVGSSYKKEGWTFFHAGIRPNKKIEQTLKENVFLKTNLHIDSEYFLGFSEVLRQGNHFVTLNFLARTDSRFFEDKTPYESLKFEWFEIENIPPIMTSLTRECLRQYFDLLGGHGVGQEERKTRRTIRS